MELLLHKRFASQTYVEIRSYFFCLFLFTALFRNYSLNVMSADAEGSPVLYQTLHAFNNY